MIVHEHVMIFVTGRCYATPVPSAPLGVPQGERAKFFDQEGCDRAMVVMDGPFSPPLGVLWLNGTADYPLLRFLTSRLVSKAPEGSPLGHMAPYLVCLLWWPLFQLRDIRLHSQPLRTPSWPFI